MVVGKSGRLLCTCEIMSIEFKLTQYIITILSYFPKKQAKDIDLYNQLKRSCTFDFTKSDFDRALMMLEIRGIIRVVPMGKNLKFVELVER